MDFRSSSLMILVGILVLSNHGLAVTSATPASVQGSTSLRALYWTFPPFVMSTGAKVGRQNATNTASGASQPSGVMSDIIADKFITDCLPSGSAVTEWTEMDSPRAVHENRDGYDIIFPITRTSTMAALMQKNSLYQFIPFIESPGKSVLRCTALSHSAIFSSILGTWPLGLALISTAVLAGIIIWVLDTYWNPEGFPQPFSRGLWEGIWWAWVTMSTVGYGDKTPRGIPGRVFAYLWILVGIIFMSIFTASVTNAISEDKESKGGIMGDKVGVINGSAEEWLAVTQGAEVKVYDIKTVMWEHVLHGSVDAVLLDSLRVISESVYMESRGITSVGTIHSPSVHGVLVHNMTEDVIQCFMQAADQSRYQLFDSVKQVKSRFKRRNMQDETTELYTGGGANWLYALVGAVFGLIAILLAGEFIYLKLFKTKSNRIHKEDTIKNPSYEG